jgi:hypothetical protein
MKPHIRLKRLILCSLGLLIVGWLCSPHLRIGLAELQWSITKPSKYHLLLFHRMSGLIGNGRFHEVLADRIAHAGRAALVAETAVRLINVNTGALVRGRVVLLDDVILRAIAQLDADPRTTTKPATSRTSIL